MRRGIKVWYLQQLTNGECMKNLTNTLLVLSALAAQVCLAQVKVSSQVSKHATIALAKPGIAQATQSLIVGVSAASPGIKIDFQNLFPFNFLR